MKETKKAKGRKQNKSLLFLVMLVLLMLFGNLILERGGDTPARMPVGEKIVEAIGGKEDPTAEELREAGVPESLISLYERNPETMQFVADYPKKKDGFERIDVGFDLKPGEMPHFLQWDERWGYEFYGEDFFAVTGCGPTCLSMVYCYLTNDGTWNPYNLSLYAAQNDYYVPGAGTSWLMMTEMAEAIGLSAEELPFDENAVYTALAEGHPVIASMGPGDFTESGHFIVLCGINDDGSIEIRDPNSVLRTKESWALADLMRQMKNCWAYAA